MSHGGEQLDERFRAAIKKLAPDAAGKHERALRHVFAGLASGSLTALVGIHGPEPVQLGRAEQRELFTRLRDTAEELEFLLHEIEPLDKWSRELLEQGDPDGDPDLVETGSSVVKRIRIAAEASLSKIPGGGFPGKEGRRVVVEHLWDAYEYLTGEPPERERLDLKAGDDWNTEWGDFHDFVSSILPAGALHGIHKVYAAVAKQRKEPDYTPGPGFLTD